jgi:hypothetical protein
MDLKLCDLLTGQAVHGLLHAMQPPVYVDVDVVVAVETRRRGH